MASLNNSHADLSPVEFAVSLDAATIAATDLRIARAGIRIILDKLRSALSADILDTISSSVDHNLRSVWLEKLVMSLGDPDKIYFAVHAQLDSSCASVVSQVREAWSDIFEIESRPTWNNGILLTMRPKGGREATENDKRLATTNDIVMGKRVYILHGDPKVHYEQKITDVLDASADYKGFMADDGRRYGLDGTVFILRLDDLPSLPRL